MKDVKKIDLMSIRNNKKEFVSLEESHPNIASQWNYSKNGDLKPCDVSAGSSKKVYFICDVCGYDDWQSIINNRTQKHTKCPVCTGNKVLKGVNDLATHYPELIKEWDYVANANRTNKNGEDISTPDKVTCGSGQKVGWVCLKCNYHWETAICLRVGSNTKGPSGCPQCAGQITIPGVNDFLTVKPELKLELDPDGNKGIDFSTISAYSTISLDWKCILGHKWRAAVKNRTLGSNCLYCTGQKAWPGYNDFATFHPELLKEWDYDKNDKLPSEYTHCSGQRVYWQCEKGHSYFAKISNRVNDRSCPICSNRQILVGDNDLATTHPDIARTWHPTLNGDLHPTQFTYGSDAKVWWLDENCGHVYDMRINERLRGFGCPYCSNRRLLVGFNDLATRNPDVADEFHSTKNGDVKPADVIFSTEKKFWFHCKTCGHDWITEVYVRTKQERPTGCPSCNNSQGELAITRILNENHIQFRRENTFPDRKFNNNRLLRDDFALLNNDKVVATIEYHGDQHYRPVDFAGKGISWAEEQFKLTKARDLAKTTYLNEHKIPQLIIPCWEYKNISQIVTQFVESVY